MPQINQIWDSFFCIIEDKPASIKLNLALNDILPVDGYKEQIWFSVKMRNPDKNGFPAEDEFKIVNDIEDAVAGMLEKEDAIFAGTIRTDGRLDCYFYCKPVENADDKIKAVMDAFPGYEFLAESKPDEKWEDYTDLLYPDDFEYQSMLNARVIYQLEQKGDNLEKERKVEHSIFFKTEASMQEFMKAINDAGYFYEKHDTQKDDEHPFCLTISRVDNVIYHNVDNYVWDVIGKAEEFEGLYNGWGCPVTK